MFRILFSLILLAAPAMAQDKAELCKISAGIADSAVAERVAGAPQDRAIDAITAELAGVNDSYIGAVQPIVEWVWTLPADQLTEEVALAYEAACLAQ